MKKYSVITLWILCIMLILSTVTFTWFTYVQRKAVTTLFTHEVAATVKLNDKVFNQNTTLSNLAFIDFENDFILDKHKAFNEIAQEMDISLTLDENSPLSRFSFDISVLQSEVIYIIILDDQVVDYHLFMSQFVVENETKIQTLNKVTVFNQDQLDILRQRIIFPNETVDFKILFWADYDSLNEPNLYKEFNAIVDINLKILSAYGDDS